MTWIGKIGCSPSLTQKAVTVEWYLGRIVKTTADIKPWSLRRDGRPLERCVTGQCQRTNDQNYARDKKCQGEKLPCILVKGLVKTCISVKLPTRKIESISVSIKSHCARALAGMKWRSSVNFTGASIICNRLGSDFLPSYYFGKLSLRSIRIRTTVFSIYSIYYRLGIEEHYLGFTQWH